MQWCGSTWWSLVVTSVITRVALAATKSGIEQFWTDDYKIFEQVYGKTSDKEIYGDTLPPSVTFSRERDANQHASHNNDRYITNYDSSETDQLDSHDILNQYKNVLNQQTLKLLSKKPSSSSVNFVSYSKFKPISLESDPDTYNYLKHLEDFNNEQRYHIPQSGGGSNSYTSYEDPDPEETDAYKSIQDILEAHEANKHSSHREEDSDGSKYLSYPKSKRKKPPARGHSEYKPRCTSAAGCRKRAAHYRSRTRPYRWTPSVKTVLVI